MTTTTDNLGVFFYIIDHFLLTKYSFIVFRFLNPRLLSPVLNIMPFPTSHDYAERELNASGLWTYQECYTSVLLSPRQIDLNNLGFPSASFKIIDCSEVVSTRTLSDG